MWRGYAPLIAGVALVLAALLAGPPLALAEIGKVSMGVDGMI